MDNVYTYLHQKRKTNTPLTEKRRRERINNSLQQLKTLVLRGKNREDNIKLEKADIMDMTVRYIEDLQHKQLTEDNEKAQLAITSYILGFTSCMNEVSRSLTAQGTEDVIKSTMSNHLSSSLYTFTKGVYHQDFNFTRDFNLNDDWRATTSPYKVSPADDRLNYQLSPIMNLPRDSSTSPSNVWTSSSSFLTTTSTCWHSADVWSINSESGVFADSSSVDSSFWRPW